MNCFFAKPYPVHFDGEHATMTGIGGVATLPQYRRRGGIRGCFEKALPDMYESGIEFSYLYPFSTAYYRKFGYELCCMRTQYKLKLQFLPTYPVTGTCTLLEQGVDLLSDIKSIYRTWQSKYNMMVENEDSEYLWVSKSNPMKDQIFTYIYRSNENVPKGFMSFKYEDTLEGRNLRCNRFFYTDLEGFKGLLNLAKTFSSDHVHLIIELPTDQFILPLLPEWSMGAGSSANVLCGMVRVVHVEKVLKMAKYRGSGEIKIQIEDPQIFQNNQTFHVTFENGKATQVKTTNSSPDIILGINDFSRLIVGACETSEIPFLPNISVHVAKDTLSKVFYKKPLLITEYF